MCGDMGLRQDRRGESGECRDEEVRLCNILDHGFAGKELVENLNV